jgi:Phage protein Gp138 N-terminal domain
LTMLSLNERAGDSTELLLRTLEQHGADLRVASPGVVQSFDNDKQTVTVKLAINERINNGGDLSWEQIPLLVDVPVLFPRAGGYAVTFPVQPGDECLVIFCDNCYDAFWQSGGTNNNQIDRRRHDLSDGMAIITGISQPNVLSGVSGNSLQIRNLAGTAIMEISGTTINILGGSVNIMNRNFMDHSHSGVQTGSGNTGGVV